MSVITGRFDVGHTDYIHDVCYDYYGTRLATCSSDRKIKVFQQNNDGQWELLSSWEAHEGPVLRLAWAHPQFGSILASCSVDHNVIVWEEQELINETDGSVQYRWKKAAGLGDSRLAVNTIAFAPPHLGLKLVAGSGDGYVRVYEAPHPLKITQWQVQNEFLADPGGVRAIAWNDSRDDDATFVVGGVSGVLKIWAHNASGRKWIVLAELKGHTDHIHDVAWAPSVGRSYHRIASASRDHTIRVWHVKPTAEDFSKQKNVNEDEPESSDMNKVIDQRSGLVQVGTGHHCDICCFPPFEDHDSEVWRVQWNVTGSVLASCGDDGVMRLWKQNLQGAWNCVSQMASTRAPPVATESFLGNIALASQNPTQMTGIFHAGTHGHE